MDEDLRKQQGEESDNHEEKLMDRRGFLLSLKKWSMVIIGGALTGGALVGSEREADARTSWVNRSGGGGWINRGGAWANRGPGWGNRSGRWANRGRHWANRGPSWFNHGGRWGNRGTSWINRF